MSTLSNPNHRRCLCCDESRWTVVTRLIGQPFRAGNWFGLAKAGLSAGQEHRLLHKDSRRHVARQMLIRQSEGTLWFTDGATPKIQKLPKDHRLLLLNVRQPLSPEVVGRWIQSHAIETLHVTGVKGEDTFVFAYLCKVFLSLGFSFRSAGNRTVDPASILLMDGADAQVVTPWPNLQVYRKARRFRARYQRRLRRRDADSANPCRSARCAAISGSNPARSTLSVASTTGQPSSIHPAVQDI